MSQPFKLTKRLRFLLEQIDAPVGEPLDLWDVGCDHGLLGLAAVHENKIKIANLVDPASAVIESIHQRLNSPKYLEWWKLNGERVRLVQARGEDVLKDARGVIVIAGMGGETIVEILKAVTKFNQLVLNPLTHFDSVKEFLKERELKFQVFTVSEREIDYQVYVVPR